MSFFKTHKKYVFDRATLLAVATLSVTSAADAALAQSQQPPTVIVANPIGERVTDWDVYTGRFQAVQNVTLQARVSGYLESIEFEEGALVEAGDLLYRIDQRPFAAAVSEAEARLNAANALRELAVIESDRADELLERQVGTQSDKQRRDAEFQEAVANVALAEAQLEIAKLNLEFTEIRAPIAGRISATDVDVGNLVIGGPAGATALANIVTVDPIEFIFTVSEADFLKYARLFDEGDRPSARESSYAAFVQLMDEDDWDRQGQMTFIDNQLDPNSGTLLGRATFENDDRFLQPGVFGRIRLPGSGEYDAYLIPDEAILADQSRLIVYTLNDDDMVEQRVVETGPIRDGMRVIRNGISSDDRVVVSGLQRARPGQQVTPELEDLAAQGSE